MFTRAPRASITVLNSTGRASKALRSFKLLHTSEPVAKSRFPRKFALFLVAGSALYLGSETVRDDIDFALHAAQRSSTVASALLQCVYHYRITLRRTYTSDNERAEALNDCHLKCALITRKALERNAGVFIKLGQHISALSYIFPSEWTRTMVPLQDQCPISSFESVCELVKSDTGKSIDQLFSHFDPLPLGTASLAQVHKANLNDGINTEVAVKVQHPSLQRYVPLDIRLTETVFKCVDFFFPEYPLQWLSDEMKRSIYVELDFTEEAQNATKTADYFKKYYQQTALKVPIVFWAKPRIMCMEYVSGIRPDDREALIEAGVDVKKLSLCFAHLFNNMIFTPGVGLHCDPHAGNVAIRSVPKTRHNKYGFEIVLYDHGLYRYVDNETRDAYARFWLAVFNNDGPQMHKYAKMFAHISDEDYRVFAAAITGRDFDSAMDGTITKRPRTQDEIRKMQQALQEQPGLASQIMQMLHKMPPVVLLILKTNDLVRYLDEQLGSPLGVTRQFVVMARYCVNTVFLEQKSRMSSKWQLLTTYLWYYWQRVKLTTVELVVR